MHQIIIFLKRNKQKIKFWHKPIFISIKHMPFPNSQQKKTKKQSWKNIKFKSKKKKYQILTQTHLHFNQTQSIQHKTQIVVQI